MRSKQIEQLRTRRKFLINMINKFYKHNKDAAAPSDLVIEFNAVHHQISKYDPSTVMDRVKADY